MNIDKLISSDENPLISVARTKDPMRVQRGMAFVYKKLSRKVKVVVTCRHNFMKYPFEDFQFLLGGKKNLLTVVSPPFYHENNAHDIVFCVVHDSRRYQSTEFNLQLKNPEPNSGQILYNSKCVFHPDQGGYPFYVMRHPTFKVDMHWAMKSFSEEGESVKPTNEVRQAELREKGFVIYPSLGMKSIVGCSGSPIFDDNLNLYGMDVRGIGDSDQLIYVPIADINKLYKQIEPEIKKYGI